MSGETALDRLVEHARAQDTDAAWTAFYQGLATTRLAVALTGRNADKVQLAEIEDAQGRAVVAFDRIERLAANMSEPADYAEIPGMDLARALAADGLAVLLNPSLPSEVRVSAEELAWIAQMFGAEVTRADASGVSVVPPEDPPPELVATLGDAVAALGMECPEAWLVEMRDTDEQGELVLVMGLARDAARMEAELAETMTRVGQAVTDRRFAVACPDRGSPLMAISRERGIGIGG